MPEAHTNTDANENPEPSHVARSKRRAGAHANGSERRSQIAWALDECIRKRGYAASTLTDIAAAAGMSPSHIHYYFEGKTAVLEYHFDALCEGILNDVLPLAGKPLLERIEATAAYFFEDPKNRRENAGVHFEIFGVAVHSHALRSTKKEWDAAMRSFFADLFLDADLPEANAERAADIAFGLLVGLRTNAFFDDDRTRGHAGAVFRSELLRLANQTPTDAPASLEDRS